MSYNFCLSDQPDSTTTQHACSERPGLIEGQASVPTALLGRLAFEQVLAILVVGRVQSVNLPFQTVPTGRDVKLAGR